MLYELEACMKYAILIKERKKVGVCNPKVMVRDMQND